MFSRHHFSQLSQGYALVELSDLLRREPAYSQSFLDYSGEIRLGGKAITQETYKEIGYLPEERSLMPKLTIFEQVRYLAALKGMSTAEVKEKLPTWMEKLQVKGKLTDKIKSLSKGNQQKVQLIITLIHEPKLIILDEPFSGLDPVIQKCSSRSSLKKKSVGQQLSFLTTS